MLKIACFLQNIQTLQGKQLKNSCDKKCKIFRALCLYELEYMEKDFQICISLLLSNFFSKFYILVCENTQAIS